MRFLLGAPSHLGLPMPDVPRLLAVRSLKNACEETLSNAPTIQGDYIGPLVAPAPALSAAAHVPVPSAAAVATAAIVTPTPAIVSQTAPPAFQDGREEMMK
ncbi:hypothetical protein E2P81_ATG07312 [Venturia nashicola]|nr:hypothetical protein E2P81_ATG07312 [Venturia nashicola]